MFTKAKTTLTNRRLQLAAVSVAIVSTATGFSAGASFSLFSATSPRQTEQLNAGSVTLISTALGTCSVSNMLPGSSSTTPCKLKATYGGTVSAYLGLDVLVATKAGNGGTNLYNPGDSSNDLQITITDDQSPSVTYVTPLTSFGSSISCPSPYNSGGYTCYQITDLLVSKSSFSNASSPVTFSTSVSLPATTTTGYRGGAAAIAVTAHAVQSSNNGSTSTCTPGQVCATVGNWS